MSSIKPIDKQQAHSLEVFYALIASLGAVGIVVVVLFLFTRSMTCC